jgi:hypothetical protein
MSPPSSGLAVSVARYRGECRIDRSGDFPVGEADGETTLVKFAARWVGGELAAGDLDGTDERAAVELVVALTSGILEE